VLGLAYRSIALPLFGSVLDKPGNSNAAEWVALLELARTLYRRVWSPANSCLAGGPRVRGLIDPLVKTNLIRSYSGFQSVFTKRRERFECKAPGAQKPEYT
jgi:hypothetical protein